MTVTEQCKQETAAKLHRYAHWLDSKRFLTLYQSEKLRFERDLTPLFSKLRKDCLFSLRQCIETQYLHEYYLKGGTKDDFYEARHCVKPIAEQCRTLANRIYPDSDYPNNQKTWRLPQGKDLLKQCQQDFGYIATKELTTNIRRIDTPYSMLQSANVREALWSIGILIESLYTLAYARNNPEFERLFSTVMIKRDGEYWAKGYPHDFLVHDAIELERGNPVKALRIHNDYCSTTLYYQQDTIAMHDKDTTLYAIRIQYPQTDRQPKRA